MAEINPNAITGLGSKLNTREIIDRFMAIEQRRIKPVEARKEQKVSELEAWEAVKSELNKLQGVTEALDKSWRRLVYYPMTGEIGRAHV